MSEYFSVMHAFYFLVLVFQIQNADDVLITPLEKFRKEQIGAAKVRDLQHTWPHSDTGPAQSSPWVSVWPTMSKIAYLEVDEYDGFELRYHPLANGGAILKLKLVKISLNLA